MKHKIMWSLIGSMIVASLILVSCAGGGGGGNGGGGGEEPKYGGIMTYRMLEPQMKGFDPLVLDNNYLLAIIVDRYFTAPWEKGPAGTGELELNVPWYPRSAYRGEMLENWTIKDQYTVTYKLRQGIHYWNKEPVNGRELTVDDIMWNWLYDTFSPKAGTYYKAMTSAEALTFWQDYLAEIESGKFTDDNLKTFLAECKQYTSEWESYYPGLKALVTNKYASAYSLLASKGYDVANLTLLNPFLHKVDKYNFVARTARCNRDLWIYIDAIWPTPREVTEVDGFSNWETVVGTGPWIPQSFDPMGESVFVRNPDYWQYDPVHPENQLPYADKLQVLMIEDGDAYYAALQTAQLDVGTVEWYKVGYFQENYPDMLYKPRINTWTHCIFVRNDIPPFNDIRVRQACMLAIDHQAIIDHYDGYAELLTWPELPQFTDVYTPLNQLPIDTQELFGYDPDKARALLEEAGYPDGFETTLTVYSATEDEEPCQIVQNYLKDIGINIKIKVPDVNTYVGILYGRQYEHMISCWWSNDFPGDAMNWAEGGVLDSIYNFGNVVDDIAHQTSLAISYEPDDAKYYAAIKADNVRRLGMMYQIIVPTPVEYTLWWPWLKNYHGETRLDDLDQSLYTHWPVGYVGGAIFKYLWIDQALKDEMGY